LATLEITIVLWVKFYKGLFCIFSQL